MAFAYTHADTDVASSAVVEAYYNDRTNDLAVVLSSGHAYVYSGVPLAVYEKLVDTRSVLSSPGRYYAKVVKRDFGPGEALGYVGWDSDEFFPNLRARWEADAATPKGLVYADDAVVTGSIDVDPAEVTNTTLALPQEKTLRRHTVVFEANGGTRTHRLNVESVDEAVEEILSLGKMLDLDFKVKEVVVSFE